MNSPRNNKHEVAEIVHGFGKELIGQYNLTPMQSKALTDIVLCRTRELGRNEEVCSNCGEKRTTYNSCGNRHCPKCQITKQLQWVEQVSQTTLPIAHYHVIFTVPHELNGLCLYNQELYYSSLFSSIWETLRSFGYSEYGVETGAIAILHSWGENLTLHPHVHCLVPAAGYTLKGEWKNIGKELFLYPVKQLSVAFKNKFVKSIRRKLKKHNKKHDFEKYIQQAYGKKWVVNCGPPFGKVENVIHYLGQYTHRVAISNQRITKVSDTHVTFIAKDYRDRAKKKPARLTGVEFLRRFCMHVFPKGFVRIRRYGIYNPTNIAKQDLAFTHEHLRLREEKKEGKKKKETALQCYKRLTGFDPSVCPSCKQKTMEVVEVIPRSRSPAMSLLQILYFRML